MKILTSPRFLNSYNRSSLGLKDLAEGAIHDFVRLHHSSPATVLLQYDLLAHLRPRLRVLEIDLSGGHRLLASLEENQLTMLEMGGHEVVRRYTSQKYTTDMASRAEAPSQFLPGQGPFFRRNPDNSLIMKYDEEGSAEWLYYLEKQQAQIDRKITSRIWKMINQKAGQIRPVFIVGGPGTGKTCILLNLLRLFGDLDESFDVRIKMSQPLVHYIEQSTNANIGQYLATSGISSTQAGLFLVDDPSSKWEIEQILDLHKVGIFVRSLVIAFDPLQLKKSLPDKEFKRLIEKYDVHVFNLSTCYRQKQNVGKEAKHVMDVVAASTPYSADYKIEQHHEDHESLTAMSNELTFVNPAGYVEYYSESKIKDVEYEVSQILEQRWLMWDHSPGLLVVEGFRPGYTLTPETREPLAPLENSNYVKWVHAEDIETIKGLEFQHVFVFIDRDMFDQIQYGFSGSGRKVYNQRRLMRIPFSRAKDRLVTFALNSD